MTDSSHHMPVARIDFHSDLDMLPLIDVLSERIGHMHGLDADSVHWLKVATREAVVNAIVHGNGSEPLKRVYVEFASVGDSSRAGVSVRVRDEGSGFDQASVPDPLDAANRSRSGGRGLLLMRAVMDDVRIDCSPNGPTEVLLLKRAAVVAAT
jgi:serine/threonine-protein kinase RsbW